MELRITPEPGERKQLLVAAAAELLHSDDGAPAAYRSGWRVSGIRENVEDGDQGEAVRPRKSPGATRA